MNIENEEIPKIASLKYHFPGYGLIQCKLFGPSAELYDFLVSKKEIKRLEELDHLGVIRRVFEGAHHSRWEYTVLLIHLIETAKDIQNLRLTSDATLRNQNKICKKELLKCWALLLNIGHLPLTFAAECALLKVVKSKSKLKSFIFSRMPDSETKGFAKKIFQQEDIYRFHHVLSAFRVARWEATKNHGFGELLRNYFFPESPEMRRLVQIFKNIRRLAFTVLDSYYLASIVKIDIRDLTSNLENFEKLIRPSPSSSKQVINDIEEHLYTFAYTSLPVAVETNAVVKNMEAVLLQVLKQGPNALFGEIYSKNILQRITNTNNSKHMLRLRYRNVRFGTPKECFPVTEHHDWEGVVGTNSEVLVWPFPDRLQKNIDVFLKKNRRSEKFSALYSVLEKLFNEFVAETSGYDGMPTYAANVEKFSEFGVSIFEFIFKNIFSFSGRIEFHGHDRSYFPDVIFTKSKADAKNLLTHAIRTFGRLKQYASKRDELQAVRACVMGEKQQRALASCSNIYFYDEGGKTIAEMDGVYLSLVGKSIKLTFVEAKDVRHSAKAEIEQQMKDMLLTRLNLRQEHQEGFQVVYQPKRNSYPAFGRVTLNLS